MCLEKYSFNFGYKCETLDTCDNYRDCYVFFASESCSYIAIYRITSAMT